jgi:tetratricopeptide (TPR) repeat protein
LHKAFDAYKCGDLVGASAHCIARLRSRPKDFDALHLLGIVQSRRGLFEAALSTFAKALELRPNDANLQNNWGAALTGAKRFDEALMAYDRALELRPKFSSAHNNRGCTLMELARYDDALASYGKAVLFDHENAEFVNNLGRAFTKLRHYEEALSCYDDALNLRPDYDEARINRGITLNELKRYEDAILCFDAVVAASAYYPDALLNLGHSLSCLERFEEALSVFDEMIRLYPERHEGLLGRAFSLAKLKRFEDAFDCLETALQRQADPVKVLIVRSQTFQEMGRLVDAIAEIDRAVAIRPAFADSHNARGMALMHADRLPEAIASLGRAIELDPAQSEAAWNLGYLSLLSGDFRGGWRYYEARRVRKGTIWTKLQGPEWRGEPLQGKRLLLYGEQGFGDTLQFARFVRVAAQMGGQVIFGVFEPLAELVRNMDERPEIVRHGERLPLYDCHAPIMSVPFILGLDEKNIPSEVPYLHADPLRVEKWKAKLPNSSFRIGIAWQGSKADRERWVPLSAFFPLSSLPGVTLISLQKTDGLEQLTGLPDGMLVETLGEDFDDGPDAFLDSAAVMMNIDLIVSIDTGLAHLAGALGCPLWILLKKTPDWRWMRDRRDSPWYPTARLFRQEHKGDWASVLEEVTRELAELLKGHEAK